MGNGVACYRHDRWLGHVVTRDLPSICTNAFLQKNERTTSEKRIRFHRLGLVNCGFVHDLGWRFQHIILISVIQYLMRLCSLSLNNKRWSKTGDSIGKPCLFTGKRYSFHIFVRIGHFFNDRFIRLRHH